MSAMNDTLRQTLFPVHQPISILDDCVVLPNVTTQLGAYAIKGDGCTRITVAPANAACVLKEGDSGTASSWTYVMNDSANAIVVFPAIGEKLGGVTNASLTIPAGATGQFVRTPRTSAVGQDWRTAILS